MNDQAIARKQREQPKERNVWEQYEQRKAELEGKGLSPSEYHEACQRIVDELGI